MPFLLIDWTRPLPRRLKQESKCFYRMAREGPSITKCPRVVHGCRGRGTDGLRQIYVSRVRPRRLRKYRWRQGRVPLDRPKALVSDRYKELFFGRLDATTLEWTDGVATALLRTASSKKRTWLCLDGDVDPAWAENLNSALDDNKVLTLPNGERIAVPSDVRFVFEVEDLSRATPATVSRCGVCHVDEELVSLQDRVESCYRRLHAHDAAFADAAQQLFAHDGIVGHAVAFSMRGGVMQSPSPEQALQCFVFIVTRGAGRRGDASDRSDVQKGRAVCSEKRLRVAVLELCRFYG